METKTKIFIGVGIGVATLLTVGIIGYKKGWFKKAGADEKPKSDPKIIAGLKEKIAVIDKQLKNPELLKFLDKDDVISLKSEYEKLKKQIA